VEYAISVVVPSTRGWPTMRRSVEPILEQLAEANAQLVVADGSGNGRPKVAQRDDVRWLDVPEGTSYDLRVAGYEAAEATVVVMTEDHCEPQAGWLRNCLAVSAERPDAAVIIGAVENGSTNHIVDWGLFCISYAQWSPPLLEADAARAPTNANLVWKRWALDLMPAVGDRRFEFRRVQELRRMGQPVVVDDRLVVRHYQCETASRTASLQFHSGRQIAGFRRNEMRGLDWLRAAAPLVFAGYRTARTIKWAREKDGTRDIVLRAAPWIALLHAAGAIGESLGYLTGPGDSGRRTH
jgi:hypothetical protein